MHLEVLDMALTKIKLGTLISQSLFKNLDELLSIESVRGISTQRTFIETYADMDGVALKNYKIVKPNYFAYVTDTSRRGDKISLAYNMSNKTYLVSSISTVFYVKDTNVLDPIYLFMFFNRPEFDRYSRFNSWGSARETFSWEEMCDIDFELPPIEIQRKYVEIYKSMVENQAAYETGLEDLETAFTALVEKLKQKYPLESFMNYVTERTEKNKNSIYSDLVGVGNTGFIVSRGSRDLSSFYKCNIFFPKDFVYNPSVIMKGAIAYNNIFDTPMICTEEYIVFYVSNEKMLLPEYLFIWLKREETGRYLEFYNIDSVRNRVYFCDLDIIKIPIPSIEIQKNIVDIFNAYTTRKQINEQLKQQIKTICPVLIKGAVEEAK